MLLDVRPDSSTGPQKWYVPLYKTKNNDSMNALSRSRFPSVISFLWWCFRQTRVLQLPLQPIIPSMIYITKSQRLKIPNIILWKRVQLLNYWQYLSAYFSDKTIKYRFSPIAKIWVRIGWQTKYLFVLSLMLDKLLAYSTKMQIGWIHSTILLSKKKLCRSLFE